MLLVRRHRFALLFVLLLVFCSAMVVRQFKVNESNHVELREEFILRYSKGYKQESEVLYHRLVRDLENVPDKALLDDYERTLMLVDPLAQKPDNPIWRYHWQISKEIENRSPNLLRRARKLAQ